MAKLSSILLVDDDPTNNFLNQRLLLRLDAAERILVAENGQEALTMLHRDSTLPQPRYPNLILLDVQMPVMGGIDFLRAYQQLPPTQQQASTIVMLTTSTDSQDLAHLEALPAAGLVSKPLTPEKLALIFQQYLPQGHSQQA